MSRKICENCAFLELEKFDQNNHRTNRHGYCKFVGGTTAKSWKCSTGKFMSVSDLPKASSVFTAPQPEQLTFNL